MRIDVYDCGWYYPCCGNMRPSVKRDVFLVLACCILYGVNRFLRVKLDSIFLRCYFNDLLACVAPRKLLIVSTDDDKYSRDAADVVNIAKRSYSGLNAEDNIVHIRYKGGHALTQERFDAIVKWILSV